MPPVRDSRILKQLRELFADPASNVVLFSAKAIGKKGRQDEGLDFLIPHEVGSLNEKIRLLKSAIVRALDQGEPVNRVAKDAGDARMAFDPRVNYEFRIPLAGKRLYVKVWLEDEDTDDPTAMVDAVKLDDRF